VSLLFELGRKEFRLKNCFQMRVSKEFPGMLILSSSIDAVSSCNFDEGVLATSYDL